MQPILKHIQKTSMVAKLYPITSLIYSTHYGCLYLVVLVVHSYIPSEFSIFPLYISPGHSIVPLSHYHWRGFPKYIYIYVYTVYYIYMLFILYTYTYYTFLIYIFIHYICTYIHIYIYCSVWIVATRSFLNPWGFWIRVSESELLNRGKFLNRNLSYIYIVLNIHTVHIPTVDQQ